MSNQDGLTGTSLPNNPSIQHFADNRSRNN